MQPSDLADSPFVRLTTFRRSGAGVGTPVWAAPDGDDLVLVTPASTGKVKRLAHTARVELSPCDRRGEVAEGAPTVEGRATVVTDEAGRARIVAALQRKYGLQFRLVSLVQRLARRGSAERVGVRISTSDPAN